MTAAVRIASDAGPWEELWLRSVALELNATLETDGESSRITTAGAVSEVVLDDAGITLRGEVRWSGTWDIHERLIDPRLAKRHVLVVMEADLSDRVDHLLAEARRAATLRGRPLTVVVIGELSRRSVSADHSLETIDGRSLARTVGMAAGTLVSSGTSATLGQLSRRAGVPTLGLDRGAEADHVLEVLSPMDALDFLGTPSPPPLRSDFAPDLMSLLGSGSSV